MIVHETTYPLPGLRPESLLAWLAGLGLLRALTVARPDWRAALAWNGLPMRPALTLASKVASRELLLEAVEEGLNALRPAFDFRGKKDLDFSGDEFRGEFDRFATSSLTAPVMDFARRLRGALACEIIAKQSKPDRLEPTGLCLMFGQGHQHFVERLSAVGSAEPDRLALHHALFEEWSYADTSPSFRWDPLEDRRYALLAGNPSDSRHKIGTVAGANRLAVVGLASHIGMPVGRRFRASGVSVLRRGRRRVTEFWWPTPTSPSELVTLERLLLGHGSDSVMRATRISNGKFMSVSQAVPDSRP